MEEGSEYLWLWNLTKDSTKKLGYIKYVINEKKGIELHWRQLNLRKESITINGQIVAKIENSGLLRYYKHEDVEDEVQKLMEKMVDKKVVATTVSSREVVLERRLETVTTSSHEEKPPKKKDADRIHISFKSKDSKRFLFTGTNKDATSKDTHEAEACDKKKQKGSRP